MASLDVGSARSRSPLDEASWCRTTPSAGAWYGRATYVRTRDRCRSLSRRCAS